MKYNDYIPYDCFRSQEEFDKCEVTVTFDF